MFQKMYISNLLMKFLRNIKFQKNLFICQINFGLTKTHSSFKALSILKLKGITPFLVLTGNPVDVRNPAYLAGILELISKLGIRSQVAILGLIPHHLVYVLMRYADFVINPSLFEGWSTTVEEWAIKKMIYQI